MPKYRNKKRAKKLIQLGEVKLEEKKEEAPLTSEKIKEEIEQYRKSIHKLVTLKLPQAPTPEEAKAPGAAPIPPEKPIELAESDRPKAPAKRRRTATESDKKYNEYLETDYNPAFKKYEKKLKAFEHDRAEYPQKLKEYTNGPLASYKTEHQHWKTLDLLHKKITAENQKKLDQHEKRISEIENYNAFLTERLDKIIDQVLQVKPSDESLKAPGNEALGRLFVNLANTLSRTIAVTRLEDFDERDSLGKAPSRQLMEGLTTNQVRDKIQNLITHKNSTSIPAVEQTHNNIRDLCKKIDYLPRDAEAKRDHIGNLTDAHVALIRQLDLQQSIQDHILDLDQGYDEIEKLITDTIAKLEKQPAPKTDAERINLDKERMAELDRVIQTINVTKAKARISRSGDLRDRIETCELDEVKNNHELKADFDDASREFEVLVHHANALLGKDSLFYKTGKNIDPDLLEIERLSKSIDGSQRKLDNNTASDKQIQGEYESHVKHKDRIEQKLAQRSDVPAEITQAFDAAQAKLDTLRKNLLARNIKNSINDAINNVNAVKLTAQPGSAEFKEAAESAMKQLASLEHQANGIRTTIDTSGFSASQRTPLDTEHNKLTSAIAGKRREIEKRYAKQQENLAAIEKIRDTVQTIGQQLPTKITTENLDFDLVNPRTHLGNAIDQLTKLLQDNPEIATHPAAIELSTLTTAVTVQLSTRQEEKDNLLAALKAINQIRSRVENIKQGLPGAITADNSQYDLEKPLAALMTEKGKLEQVLRDHALDANLPAARATAALIQETQHLINLLKIEQELVEKVDKKIPRIMQAEFKSEAAHAATLLATLQQRANAIFPELDANNPTLIACRDQLLTHFAQTGNALQLQGKIQVLQQRLDTEVNPALTAEAKDTQTLLDTLAQASTTLKTLTTAKSGIEVAYQPQRVQFTSILAGKIDEALADLKKNLDKARDALYNKNLLALSTEIKAASKQAASIQLQLLPKPGTETFLEELDKYNIALDTVEAITDELRSKVATILPENRPPVSELIDDINDIYAIIDAKRDAGRKAHKQHHAIVHLYQSLASDIENAYEEIHGITAPEAGKAESFALITAVTDELDELEQTEETIRDRISQAMTLLPEQREELEADLNTLAEAISVARSELTDIIDLEEKINVNKQFDDSFAKLHEEVIAASQSLSKYLDSTDGKIQGDCLDEKFLAGIEAQFENFVDRLESIGKNPFGKLIPADRWESFKKDFNQLQDNKNEARDKYDQHIAAIESSMKQLQPAITAFSQTIPATIDPETDLPGLLSTVADHKTTLDNLRTFVNNPAFKPNNETYKPESQAQIQRLESLLANASNAIANGIQQYIVEQHRTLLDGIANANQSLPVLEGNLNYKPDCHALKQTVSDLKDEATALKSLITTLNQQPFPLNSAQQSAMDTIARSLPSPGEEKAIPLFNDLDNKVSHAYKVYNIHIEDIPESGLESIHTLYNNIRQDHLALAAATNNHTVTLDQLQELKTKYLNYPAKFAYLENQIDQLTNRQENIDSLKNELNTLKAAHANLLKYINNTQQETLSTQSDFDRLKAQLVQLDQDARAVTQSTPKPDLADEKFWPAVKTAFNNYHHLEDVRDSIDIRDQAFSPAQRAELQSLATTANTRLTGTNETIQAAITDYLKALKSAMATLQSDIYNSHGSLLRTIEDGIFKADETLLSSLEITMMPNHASQLARIRAIYQQAGSPATMLLDINLLDQALDNFGKDIRTARNDFYYYNLPALIKRQLPTEFKTPDNEVKPDYLAGMTVIRPPIEPQLHLSGLNVSDIAFNNAIRSMIEEKLDPETLNKPGELRHSPDFMLPVGNVKATYEYIERSGDRRFKESFVPDACAMLTLNCENAIETFKELITRFNAAPELKALKVEDSKDCADYQNTMQERMNAITQANTQRDIPAILTLRTSPVPVFDLTPFLNQTIQTLQSQTEAVTANFPGAKASLNELLTQSGPALQKLAKLEETHRALTQFIATNGPGTLTAPLATLKETIDHSRDDIEQRIRQRLDTDITNLQRPLTRYLNSLQHHKTDPAIDMVTVNGIQSQLRTPQFSSTAIGALQACANNLRADYAPAEKARLLVAANQLVANRADVQGLATDAENYLRKIATLQSDIAERIKITTDILEQKTDREPVTIAKDTTTAGHVTLSLHNTDPGIKHALQRTVNNADLSKPLDLTQAATDFGNNQGNFHQHYCAFYLPERIKQVIPAALKDAKGEIKSDYMQSVTLNPGDQLTFNNVAQDAAFHNALLETVRDTATAQLDPSVPLAPATKHTIGTLTLSNPDTLYNQLTKQIKDQKERRVPTLFEERFVTHARNMLTHDYNNINGQVPALLPADPIHRAAVEADATYQDNIRKLDEFKSEIDSASTAEDIVTLRNKQPTLAAIPTAIQDVVNRTKPAAPAPRAIDPTSLLRVLSQGLNTNEHKLNDLIKLSDRITQLMEERDVITKLIAEVAANPNLKDNLKQLDDKRMAIAAELMAEVEKLYKLKSPSTESLEKILGQYKNDIDLALKHRPSEAELTTLSVAARLRANEQDKLLHQYQQLVDHFANTDPDKNLTNQTLLVSTMDYDETVDHHIDIHEWAQKHGVMADERNAITMDPLTLQGGRYHRTQPIPKDKKHLSILHFTDSDNAPDRVEARALSSIALNKNGVWEQSTLLPPALDPYYIMQKAAQEAANDFLGKEGMRDPRHNPVPAAIKKDIDEFVTNMVTHLIHQKPKKGGFFSSDQQPFSEKSIKNYLNDLEKRGELKFQAQPVMRKILLGSTGSLLASHLAQTYEEAMNPVSLHIAAAKMINKYMATMGLNIASEDSIRGTIINIPSNTSRELTQAIANYCAFRNLHFKEDSVHGFGITGDKTVIDKLIQKNNRSGDRTFEQIMIPLKIAAEPTMVALQERQEKARHEKPHKEDLAELRAIHAQWDQVVTKQFSKGDVALQDYHKKEMDKLQNAHQAQTALLTQKDQQSALAATQKSEMKALTDRQKHETTQYNEYKANPSNYVTQMKAQHKQDIQHLIKAQATQLQKLNTMQKTQKTPAAIASEMKTHANQHKGLLEVARSGSIRGAVTVSFGAPVPVPPKPALALKPRGGVMHHPGTTPVGATIPSYIATANATPPTQPESGAIGTHKAATATTTSTPPNPTPVIPQPINLHDIGINLADAPNRDLMAEFLHEMAGKNTTWLAEHETPSDLTSPITSYVSAFLPDEEKYSKNADEVSDEIIAKLLGMGIEEHDVLPGITRNRHTEPAESRIRINAELLTEHMPKIIEFCKQNTNIKICADIAEDDGKALKDQLGIKDSPRLGKST